MRRNELVESSQLFLSPAHCVTRSGTCCEVVSEKEDGGVIIFIFMLVFLAFEISGTLSAFVGGSLGGLRDTN